MSVLDNIMASRNQRMRASFIEVLMPVFLNVFFHGVFGKSVDATITSALEQVIFGAMIIKFLIFEPLGLARLWQLAKRDCGSGRSGTEGGGAHTFHVAHHNNRRKQAMANQSLHREERHSPMRHRLLSGFAAAGALAALVLAPSAAMAQAQEQYFGIPSSRVGPYSAMGTGYYGGIIDYLNYVNMKHGGVKGVKLTYDECETEYNAARTVECYQRLLNKGDQRMVVFDTLGTPGAYLDAVGVRTR